MYTSKTLCYYLLYIILKKYHSLQDIVPWRKSRTILYWRLRRRLLEDRLIKALMEVQPELALGQGEAMLRRWFIEDKGASEVSLSKPSFDYL